MLDATTSPLKQMLDATRSPLKKGEAMLDDILNKNISEPLTTSEEALGISLIKRKQFKVKSLETPRLNLKIKEGNQ